jgi:uncharacterized membrane protein
MPDDRSMCEMQELIGRNLTAIRKIEQKALDQRTAPQRISDRIANFCGTMVFVYIHVAWFAVWLGVNTLSIVPRKYHFDSPPFSTLTLLVSLEAIFLTTFVLISQNRQQRISEGRNELDLQINLIAEQETTKIIKMLANIQDRLGIQDQDSKALTDPVDPQELAEAIEEQIIKANERKT